MNQTVIIGNLGANPELRYTQSGKPLVTMNIATNRKVRDEEVTTWHHIEVWDKLAENCAATLAAGTRVIVVGRNEQFSWEDKKTGERRTKSLIVATDVAVSLSRATATIEKA